ncbi:MULTISPECIES: hypothetical protein [Sporosarcina]|uniref:Uncharacterized protein n=1 Tax=Sporosarcina psychrophila TaxID=1476 RepID=A0ABV2KCR3_SPOPS|nr:hypothetical protein [Sporosarcina sp. resist]QNK89612.1 hypothetical protein H7992_08130 [Sporosarcina sp. resist]
MHGYPEENDLLSLFECEPTLLDTTSLDFFYNRATYRFSNGEEDFIVTLSPSYGEVKIQVTQRASNQLISLMDLKRVDKFEITADKKDLSSVLLMLLNDDFITQTIEIDFKPKYKLIFREHYTR